MRCACWMAWLVLFSLTTSVNAQTITLIESPKPKDCNRVEIAMRLTGEQIFFEEGQQRTHKVTASAEHRFAEKVLAVQSKTGMAAKVARYYEVARANVTFNDRPEVKTL